MATVAEMIEAMCADGSGSDGWNFDEYKALKPVLVKTGPVLHGGLVYFAHRRGETCLVGRRGLGKGETVPDAADVLVP